MPAAEYEMLKLPRNLADLRLLKGLFFVVFNATAGASCCYFLSKLIGIPIVNWLWPEKHRFFQAEAGLALGELKLVKDLYDLKTLVVLFLIGSILLLPTLLKRKRIYD
ncbi:SNARE associated Golgi protein family [Striga asiatica]|uniref:SNARE associated Golgi protein family n=1 Tax=Striga asiatica TaxID=4170 RepID=A0A5A7QHL6_STRAF|nr:SNARE associated Golgi protein family [Striga asiatica]